MNAFILYYLLLGVSMLAALALLAIWIADIWSQHQARKRRRLGLEMHPFLWKPHRENRRVG